MGREFMLEISQKTVMKEELHQIAVTEQQLL